MPFVLIVIGIVLVIGGIRNTIGGDKGLISLVKSDFTGTNNFTYWAVSIAIIGGIGYIETLKPVSRAFMTLVILVLILSNGGVFQKLNASLQSKTQTATSGK
jgi:hypothetical protein